MNNYHYIIASLPLLQKGADNSSFDLDRIKEGILGQLSDKDVSIVNFFCRMMDGSTLDRDYYKSALKSRSTLTRRYSNIDRQMRNMKVRQTAKTLYSEEEARNLVSRYVIEEAADPYAQYKEPGVLEADFSDEDKQVLSSVFSDNDIVSKEKRLDQYKWEKIDSLTTFDYFDIDCILAFLAKGHLVSRWMKLDAAKGKHLFRKLLDEVRGTFDNNKLKYSIDENNG